MFLLIIKNFRSTRSVEALTEFVRKQLEISINEFPTLDYLNGAINAEKRNVIAYFHCRDCVEYQNFQVRPQWIFPLIYLFCRKSQLYYVMIAHFGLDGMQRLVLWRRICSHFGTQLHKMNKKFIFTLKIIKKSIFTVHRQFWRLWIYEKLAYRQMHSIGQGGHFRECWRADRRGTSIPYSFSWSKWQGNG